MRCKFDGRLKFIATACFLSAFIAGAICTLVSPVTANNAADIVISVNRSAKGDRLSIALIAQPTQRDSVPTKKSIPGQTMLGCEPAFSQLTDPTRRGLLRHCTA